MAIVGRFLLHLSGWAGAFLIVVALVWLLGGERGEGLVFPIQWVAGALTLAAFPAGIAVAGDVLRWHEPRIRPLLGLAAAAGLVGLLAIGVRGYVGPALARQAAGPPEPGARADAASIYLHDRLPALHDAYAAAEARADGGVAAWRAANQLAWSLDRTIVGGLLAATFTGIGCLFGGWTRRIRRPEPRRAACWALGLFLLLTTYLMGENSYELIVVHMAGPALFAAWLPLIGPGMLLLGLAIPTGVELARTARTGSLAAATVFAALLFVWGSAPVRVGPGAPGFFLSLLAGAGVAAWGGRERLGRA